MTCKVELAVPYYFLSLLLTWCLMRHNRMYFLGTMQYFNVIAQYDGITLITNLSPDFFIMYFGYVHGIREIYPVNGNF